MCRNRRRHRNRVRHRDLLQVVSVEDADLPVNELLAKFTAAFLDRGVSHCSMPGAAGFLPLRSPHCIYKPPGASHRLASPTPRRTGANSRGEYFASGFRVRVAARRARRAENRMGRVHRGDPCNRYGGFAGMIHQTELARRPRRGSGSSRKPGRVRGGAVAAGPRSCWNRPIEGGRLHRPARWVCVIVLRSRQPAWVPPRPARAGFRSSKSPQILKWSPDELGDDSAAALGNPSCAKSKRSAKSNGGRILHLAYEAHFRTPNARRAWPLHERRKPRLPRFQLVTCIGRP